MSTTSNQAHPVLYIDGQEYNRQAFSLSFQEQFPLLVAKTTEEALEIIAKTPISVAIVDDCPQEPTAQSLLQTLREKRPETIRVLLTTSANLSPILKAVNSGLVSRYILKPWKLEELTPILRWSLEAHQLGLKDDAVQSRLLETERLVTLGSIGAGVLHDLKNPLAYLSYNCERISQLATAGPALGTLLVNHGESVSPRERSLLHSLSEELTQIGEDMTAGCEVLQDLTSNLAAFSKPVSETTSAPSLSPLPIIRYAVSVTRGSALLSRCKVQYTGPSTLPTIKIGRTQLTQILVNLLDNAVWAAATTTEARGTVTLSASVVPNSMETEEHLPTPSLRFIVEDNGPGIPEEILNQLGTAFFTTRSKGTGLGLYQCKRLIAEVDGTFHIESLQERGTRVSFTLPLDQPGQKPCAPPDTLN